MLTTRTVELVRYEVRAVAEWREILLLRTSLFCFFFSSRRRHTRYWRDWSSDVCSSDLGAAAQQHGQLVAAQPGEHGVPGAHVRAQQPGQVHQRVVADGVAVHVVDRLEGRSEERRVGKECRSRWSPYH